MNHSTVLNKPPDREYKKYAGKKDSSKFKVNRITCIKDLDDKAKMRPTFLPNCKCTSRRLIIVDDIIRCANCYMRYSEAGSYNYTDGFLKSLVDRADKNDKFHQAFLRLNK